MYYSDEYLAHYGVLGMKWGQHLFGGRSSRTSKTMKSLSKKATVAKERVKRGANTAKDWTYEHRNEIAMGAAIGATVIGVVAASPYIAIGARAAGSVISSLASQSASTISKAGSDFAEGLGLHKSRAVTYYGDQPKAKPTLISSSNGKSVYKYPNGTEVTVYTSLNN